MLIVTVPLLDNNLHCGSQLTGDAVRSYCRNLRYVETLVA